MEDKSVQFEVGEVQRIPRHTSDSLEIFFLLKGQVKFDLDGSCYTLEANDIIVCNPHQSHGAENCGPNIMFRLSLSRDFLLEEIGTDEVSLICNSRKYEGTQNTFSYQQIRHLLRVVLNIQYRKNQFSKLERKSALLKLLSVLHERFRMRKTVRISPIYMPAYRRL